MQARLNSPLAFKMADEYAGEERTNSNVCRLELLVWCKCGREVERVGQKCCAAANSNNESKK